MDSLCDNICLNMKRGYVMLYLARYSVQFQFCVQCTFAVRCVCDRDVENYKRSPASAALRTNLIMLYNRRRA